MLCLQSLDLAGKERAEVAAIRLRDSDQVVPQQMGHSSILNNNNIVPVRTDNRVPGEYTETPVNTIIAHRNEWLERLPGPNGAISIFTDGSKLDESLPTALDDTAFRKRNALNCPIFNDPTYIFPKAYSRGATMERTTQTEPPCFKSEDKFRKQRERDAAAEKTEQSHNHSLACPIKKDNQLSKVHRTAALCISGALRTTPNDPLNAMLCLQSLDLAGKERAEMAAIRLRDSDQVVPQQMGHSSILNNNNIVPVRTDNRVPGEYTETPVNTIIAHRNEWLERLPGPNGAISIFTDGSKLDESLPTALDDTAFRKRNALNCPIFNDPTYIFPKAYSRGATMERTTQTEPPCFKSEDKFRKQRERDAAAEKTEQSHNVSYVNSVSLIDRFARIAFPMSFVLFIPDTQNEYWGILDLW
ncbi:GL18077 [Drosophila persimilis]|uniref:GL18077 n=1 Tax=Drosophila persimilis TaxID=7234 RepID=B4HD51_DROPE|nr:GL18077 [Drosophila persimilis]